jgi:S-adenosylmethionine decarboxylase
MISPATIMNVGTEWIVDAQGCSAELLRDVETIRRVCEQIIRDLELRVVGDGVWHKFPHPGGVTGMFLLTESHLACHTYPEVGVATFNLYCCRSRPRWLWEKRLSDALCASNVTVRVATRGAGINRADESFETEAEDRAIPMREVRKR